MRETRPDPISLRGAALVAFILGLIKIVMKCSGESVSDLIMAQTYLTVMSIGIVGIMTAAALAPLAIALTAIALSIVVGALMFYFLSQDPNCSARRMMYRRTSYVV